MTMLTINLLPPRIKAARLQRMMISIAVAVGIAIMALPASLIYVKYTMVNGLKKQYKLLEAASKEYSGVIEKVEELKTKEATLAKRLDSIDKLIQRQWIWIKLLEITSQSQAKVKDIWLTRISSKALTGVDQGWTEVTIEGKAFSLASVTEFRKVLSAAEIPIKIGTVELTGDAEGVPPEAVVRFKTMIKFKG